MRRSNCGVVYSRLVCPHRSALRNNKMELKRRGEGIGGERAGVSLLKE